MKALSSGEKYAMIETIGKVVDAQSMPKTHNQHIDNKAYLSRMDTVMQKMVAHDKPRKPHKNKITQPSGKCDVPSVPEIKHIDGNKRCLKIAWTTNTQTIACTHCHKTIPLEIKE